MHRLGWQGLRASFDHFADQKAAQVLSTLATDSTLILGHVLIGAEEVDKNP